MKDNKIEIEERLENIKNFYIKASELIDKLPDSVPEKIRIMLKETVLGDKDLKKLMDDIDSHRPPRIFLIGRTGVGKSSLINAICGAYVATVSDTESCTGTTNTYTCMDGDRVLMEILDTRGIAESESLNSEISAEEMLISQISEFSPDIVIMMLNCTHRDDIISDVDFLKKVARNYKATNAMRLPIVVVVNKCDEMAPTRFKEPEHYPQKKVDKIQEVVQNYKKIIVKNGLKIDNIVPVASLIDWQTSDGMEVGSEEIPFLPDVDRDGLEIAFDGRYNIEELIDILEEAILDSEAKMGLRMATRLTDVVNRLANHLTSIFSVISATVAVTPIPTSDIYILVIIQTILVGLIASLSGRELSLDSAKEFIFSIGGIGSVGYGFRLLAQQSSKLLNVFLPGAGSAVSSTLAYAGTFAIGKAAIVYYIDDKSIELAMQKFNDEKNSNISNIKE